MLKESKLTVNDIMTRNPIIATSTDTIQKVADSMFGADVRHIPILKNGELVGMISDRDIRSYMLPVDVQVIHPSEARERLEEEVGSIVQDDVIFVSPEASLSEAIEIMLDEKVGAVPVVDPREDRFVGIISYIDILRAAKDVL